MSASSGHIGAATTLSYSADGTTWTALSEVIDVDAPGMECKKVDFTNYGSPNTQKEYKPGWKDGQDVEVEIAFLAAQETTLRGFVGVQKYWQIQIADATTGSKWVWQGFITKIGAKIPNEERITQKLTICVNTAITFTAGS
jgi:hypothetical protein